MKTRFGQKIRQGLGVLAVGLVMALSFGWVLEATPVLAADKIEKIPTSLFGDEVDVSADSKHPEKNVFFRLLYTFVNILIYGLGGLAVIGVVVAGIMYITSGDNEQKAVAARKRLIEVVIGLAVWALLYVILRLLVPGKIMGTT